MVIRRATRRSSPRLQGKGSTHFFFFKDFLARPRGSNPRHHALQAPVKVKYYGTTLLLLTPPLPPFPTSPPLRGLREQDRFFKGFLQAFFTRLSLNSGRPVCNFGVKKLTRRKSKRKAHTPGERGGEWRGEFILSC